MADLGSTPTLATLAGFGDSRVIPGDEVYVVTEDADFVYRLPPPTFVADGTNWVKAIFLPGTWVRRSNGTAPQPSNLQGSIILDPQNSTGLATSTGQNTTTVQGVTGRVFQFWRDLVAAWGTMSPFLTQNTLLFFASSSPASGDPIFFYPVSDGFIDISFQGATTLFATATLSAVVAKNRATNTLLQANFGTATPDGTVLLVNNTRSNSVAFAYKTVAGNTHSITQPYNPLTIPITFAGFPTANNAWANGDTVQEFTLTGISLAECIPSIRGQSNPAGPAYQAGVNFYRVNIFNNAIAPAIVFGRCNIFESIVQGTPVLLPTYYQTAGINPGSHIWNAGLLAGMSCAGGSVEYIGGQIVERGGTNDLIECDSPLFSLDGDVCINGSFQLKSGLLKVGLCYIDNLNGIYAITGVVESTNYSYGQHIIWGSAGSSILMGNNTLMRLVGGTYTAAWVAAALVSPGIVLNGSVTASSFNNAQPQVLQGGIGLTVANLDAAQGVAGFGGIAVKLGGASVRNTQ